MEILVANGMLSVGMEITYPTGRGVVTRITVDTREGWNDYPPITSHNIEVKPKGKPYYDKHPYRRIYLHNPLVIQLVEA